MNLYRLRVYRCLKIALNFSADAGQSELWQRFTAGMELAKFTILEVRQVPRRLHWVTIQQTNGDWTTGDYSSTTRWAIAAYLSTTQQVQHTT